MTELSSVSSLSVQVQRLQKKVEKLTAMSFLACVIFLIVFVTIGIVYYTVVESREATARDVAKLTMAVTSIKQDHTEYLKSIKKQNQLLMELLGNARTIDENESAK